MKQEPLRYPNLQVVIDCKGNAYQRFFLVPNDGVLIKKQPGEILADFVELNLVRFRAQIDEIENELEAETSKQLQAEQYNSLASKITETSELLRPQNEMFAEFLYDRTSEILSEGKFYADAEQLLHSLRSAIETLRSAARMQNRYMFFVSGCLAPAQGEVKPYNENLASFLTLFQEQRHLTWKTQMVFAPLYKGRLDTQALECLNGTETDEELLQIFQRSHAKGASITECSVLETLEEILWFDFLQALRWGKVFKRCQLCGRYFIVHDLRQTYCSRVFRDGKTCKQTGSILAHKEALESDPVLRDFERLRIAMYFRASRCETRGTGKITVRDLSMQEYEQWLSAATKLRDRYIAGELSGDELMKEITPPDYLGKAGF